MSYVDKNLMSGETVVYRGKLTWLVYSLPIVLALLAIAIMFLNVGAGLLFLLLAGLVGLVVYISASSSEFAVTNKRVILKVGWLNRRSVELLLTKVESISVEQGLRGKIFGFGNIVVSGTGGSHEPFKNVDNPFEFRKQVQEQISAVQDAPRAYVPASATPTRAERECPYCAETILAKARICKHCGKEVEPLAV
ncbi:MAG TPA: PH domain-containing protein [Gemmatimonadales bacterium]|jgi:uncharacterized membrane protein YdbT with pleckstrin-like domain